MLIGDEEEATVVVDTDVPDACVETERVPTPEATVAVVAPGVLDICVGTDDEADPPRTTWKLGVVAISWLLSPTL